MIMADFIPLWRTMKRVASSSLLLGLVISTSCRRPVPDSHREDAVDLYSKSVKLIRQYIDSLSNAVDSAEVIRINNRFEHDLTALNFKYPSETCLEISEGENDTLTNLTERLIQVRDSAFYRFAHPELFADTITADSIAIDSIL